MEAQSGAWSFRTADGDGGMGKRETGGEGSEISRVCVTLWDLYMTRECGPRRPGDGAYRSVKDQDWSLPPPRAADAIVIDIVIYDCACQGSSSYRAQLKRESWEPCRPSSQSWEISLQESVCSGRPRGSRRVDRKQER